MITRALLARLETRRGKDAEVQAVLQSAAAAVQDETGTDAWFAAKCGRNHYVNFAAFAHDDGRTAHLAGGAARELRTRAAEYLTSPLRIERCEVLAAKLAAEPGGPRATKAVLLRLTVKDTKANRLEEFLREVETIAQEEIQTLAWFGLRFGRGEFGLFSVFPDDAARTAHLAGQIPRELSKHAFALLGGVPDPDLCDVFGEKITVTAGN